MITTSKFAAILAFIAASALLGITDADAQSEDRTTEPCKFPSEEAFTRSTHFDCDDQDTIYSILLRHSLHIGKGGEMTFMKAPDLDVDVESGFIWPIAYTIISAAVKIKTTARQVLRQSNGFQSLQIAHGVTARKWGPEFKDKSFEGDSDVALCLQWSRLGVQVPKGGDPTTCFVMEQLECKDGGKVYSAAHFETLSEGVEAFLCRPPTKPELRRYRNNRAAKKHEAPKISKKVNTNE